MSFPPCPHRTECFWGVAGWIPLPVPLCSSGSIPIRPPPLCFLSFFLTLLGDAAGVFYQANSCSVSIACPMLEHIFPPPHLFPSSYNPPPDLITPPCDALGCNIIFTLQKFFLHLTSSFFFPFSISVILLFRVSWAAFNHADRRIHLSFYCLKLRNNHPKF